MDSKELVSSLSELFEADSQSNYGQWFLAPMPSNTCLSMLSFEQNAESEKLNLRKSQRKFGVKRLTSFEKQNIENHRKNIESSYFKLSTFGNTDELTQIAGCSDSFSLFFAALQNMEQQLTQHMDQKYPTLVQTCQKTEQLTYLLIDLLQSSFRQQASHCLWLADSIAKHRQKNMQQIRRAINESRLEEYLSKKCYKIFDSRKNNQAKAGNRKKYSSMLARFLKEMSKGVILCLEGIYEYHECQRQGGLS